jgi:hypothetical protein
VVAANVPRLNAAKVLSIMLPDLRVGGERFWRVDARPTGAGRDHRGRRSRPESSGG